MPQLSVIIPAYNAMNFLPITLDSHLAADVETPIFSKMATKSIGFQPLKIGVSELFGNGARYELDGVLKQTFQDFEVIMVDDGSSDSIKEWNGEQVNFLSSLALPLVGWAKHMNFWLYQFQKVWLHIRCKGQRPLNPTT